MSRAFSAAAACALVMVLTGCADGYPSQDEPLALAFGMDRTQVHLALNQIGEHRYLEHRWQYRLDETCRLRVESRGLDNRSVELSKPGPGWSATMKAEADTETRMHTVSVRQEDSASAPETTVIAGANWSDASQIKWLMDYLPVLCGQGPLR